MSKDRDGIEDDERLPPEVDGAAADEPTDLDSTSADDVPDTQDESDPVDADDVDDGAAAADPARDDEPAADDADASGSDDDLDADEKDEKVGATAKAGVAGSNRAAARMASSSRTAATTEKKEAPTRPRDTVERAGFFARIGRFIREVVAELRKVIWPSRKQWATFTLVVIVFLVIMVALVSGMDVLFHLIVGRVFG